MLVPGSIPKMIFGLTEDKHEPNEIRNSLRGIIAGFSTAPTEMTGSNNFSETLSISDRLHLRTNFSRNPSFMIPFEKNGKSKNMRLFICAIITFLTIKRGAQSNAQCIVENHAFNVGEKITYKIAYNWHALWLTAGEASFTVDQATLDNRPCYHVTGYGYSYQGYDWFYKVRDTYETYMDLQTMQPLKFVRNIYEDGFTLYQNVTFNQDEHKAISLKTTIDIPDCIQDVLSAIYYARNIDFSKYNYNDTIPMFSLHRRSRFSHLHSLFGKRNGQHEGRHI